MNNIFEGAKFGDRFLTRDGRVALYVGYLEQTHRLIPEGEIDVQYWYYSDGTINAINCEEHDIVSKYKESIDEEKLDELADKYINVINKGPFDDNDIPTNLTFKDINDCIKAGFINGYRKAKEK